MCVSLTNEKRWGRGRVSGVEMSPFVEDKDDQVEENTGQENDLRKEFQVDRVPMIEMPKERTCLSPPLTLFFSHLQVIP